MRKYNTDKIFKQHQIIKSNMDIEENRKEISLVEAKENFFSKFIKFIKNIFKIS